MAHQDLHQLKLEAIGIELAELLVGVRCTRNDGLDRVLVVIVPIAFYPLKGLVGGSDDLQVP